MITQCFDYANVNEIWKQPLWFQKFCLAYFITSPLLYAFIRAAEPAVWATVKQKCRIKKDVNDSETNSQTVRNELYDELNGFLTSTLNVELVYVILKAICDSVGNSSDIESYRNGFIHDESTLHRSINKIVIPDC
jgi:hypothetical protein